MAFDPCRPGTFYSRLSARVLTDLAVAALIFLVFNDRFGSCLSNSGPNSWGSL